MRDIIFRGKRVNNGEWVYGWHCMYSFGQWPLKNAIVQLEKAHNGCFEPIEVENTTVGQYTGLQDKNGKRIFEGDIITVPWSEDKFVVNFQDGQFVGVNHRKFRLNQLLVDIIIGNATGVEVIGNIHDNPELLEDNT